MKIHQCPFFLLGCIGRFLNKYISNGDRRNFAPWRPNLCVTNSQGTHGKLEAQLLLLEWIFLWIFFGKMWKDIFHKFCFKRVQEENSKNVLLQVLHDILVQSFHVISNFYSQVSHLNGYFDLSKTKWRYTVASSI